MPIACVTGMAPPSPPRQASSAPSSREPPAWSRELSALVRLATPLAAARIGFILLGVVDTAVVGRLGESALGAVGIANSIFYAIAMLGGGLVMGVDPVITQALGAEDEPLAARGFWQSLWLALALSLPMSLLAICAPVIFDPIGVDPQTAELATVYLWSRVPGLALMLVYTAFRTLFQAHGVTRPMVVGVIVANLVNLPLNILLVFGDQGLADAGLPTLGVPALGIVGAGITSSVATLLQLLVVVVALVQRLPEAARVRPPERQLLVKAARVGSPIGLQRLAEMGLFSVTGLAMARIGTRAVASHQVVMTLVTATFMVPLGVSAAAAVRVGRAIGAGDVRAARRSGFVAFGLAGAVMAVAASSMVLFPRTLAAI
ncbi:MAG: MATE family efflux transporter, partial [Myxococcales bacterium]|nr:MATE family efflux transporter [Myxococcales bacterium]